jgi:protein-disulfide isomerase
MPRNQSVLTVLAASGLLLVAQPLAATERASGAGITTEQADAILEELRAIRTLLEQDAGGRRGAQMPAPAAPTVVRVPWADRPTLGAPDAAVIVIEFSDYACPYCQRFHQATWPVLKRDFVDTGQVRWSVRDLPLPIHPNARGAAQAAHCAGEQGRFWEMRSALFAGQSDLGREALEKYADAAGAGREAFSRCMDGDKHLDEIDADSRDAANIRITGTPTFLVGRRNGDFVEGRLIVGAQGSAVFDGAIRLELAAGNSED